jgi:hypothetical protein
VSNDVTVGDTASPFILVRVIILKLPNSPDVVFNVYFLFFGEINLRAEALGAIVAGRSCTRR